MNFVFHGAPHCYVFNIYTAVLAVLFDWLGIDGVRLSGPPEIIPCLQKFDKNRADGKDRGQLSDHLGPIDILPFLTGEITVSISITLHHFDLPLKYRSGR